MGKGGKAMCHDKMGNQAEFEFEDKNLNRCVVRISRLQTLIAIEEQRLLKELRLRKTLKSKKALEMH